MVGHIIPTSPTTIFPKKKTHFLPSNVNINKVQEQGTLHQLRLFRPLFSHVPRQPVAKPPNALLSTGLRLVTGPLKGWNWMHNYNMPVYATKNSNKQTLSFKKTSYSFPLANYHRTSQSLMHQVPNLVQTSITSSGTRFVASDFDM